MITSASRNYLTKEMETLRYQRQNVLNNEQVQWPHHRRTNARSRMFSSAAATATRITTKSAQRKKNPTTTKPLNKALSKLQIGTHSDQSIII